jgi:hypothetical protein
MEQKKTKCKKCNGTGLIKKKIKCENCILLNINFCHKCENRRKNGNYVECTECLKKYKHII